jgi:hypothetical protein
MKFYFNHMYDVDKINELIRKVKYTLTRMYEHYLKVDEIRRICTMLMLVDLNKI